MKSILSVLILFCVSVGCAMAQDGDATDLSRYEIFEDGESLKTLSDLDQMQLDYEALISAADCSSALPLIVEFHGSANKTANLLRRGSEPYYGARRDDQEKFARFYQDTLGELADVEGVFNNLIKERNKAWVAEAKCLLEQGEQDAAVLRLYRALDYISIDEGPLWAEARNLLWSQVGYDATN